MLKRYALGTLSLAIAVLSTAQTFTNATSSLPVTTASGGCVGVTDMDGDGLDDVATLDGSDQFRVFYQNPDGSFTDYDYGTVSTEAQWGFALGDIDNNGHKDLISGGSYDGVHYLSITSRGVATMASLNNGSLYTQCVNMADVNNDGHADYFACHDDGAPRIWLNDGSGNLAYDITGFDFMTNPATDMSGNYGSVWTDFDNDGDIDLYIAKCRQGVNSQADPRRWDRLFVNDGNGNYTDQAAAYGVENRWQTWSVDFGDVDNDGDLDLVATNHDNTIQLFENDGTGHYTEVTAGSGLEETGFFLQSHFEDFDNDGFLDLLVAGGVSFYFQGNGDLTFTEVTGLLPAAKVLHSFGIGDLNNDGFRDVFASYGDGYVSPDPSFPDRLWLNTPNANHWLDVKFEGTTSNRDGIGARATIYGPWGVQIREVRAGESYGIVNSFTAHFGLGPNTQVDSLVVSWPSGTVDTYTNIPADQAITALEGVCLSPTASITTAGSPIVCTGGAPLTLTANPGYTYLWSTGGTTQSIDVTAGGAYTVTIDDGQGCTGQTSITVAQDPDETPTVSASGETTICALDEVTLTSSAATGYQWSNGATTQSITVNAAASYTVTVTGTCGSYTSIPVVVDVLTAAAAPAANDVTIPVPGTADLTATGDSISWFDVAVGGTPVGAGDTWTTPFLNVTTSFWAEDAVVYGGGTSYGGRTTNATPGAYHTNADNYLVFEANEDFILRSVKVYANGTANRTIGLVELNGGTVLAQSTISIPDGESRVQLDFNVPAGGPYGLRVIGGNPQLWRDANGSNPVFPYALGSLGTITGTTVGAPNTLNFYYFFYDWEVEEPTTLCAGPRTEVLVTVGPVGIGETTGAAGLTVFPNPADDLVTIGWPAATGEVVVDVLDITGRIVRTTRAGAATGRMELDVDALAAGDYTVRVRVAGATAVQRLVVR